MISMTHDHWPRIQSFIYDENDEIRRWPMAQNEDAKMFFLLLQIKKANTVGQMLRFRHTCYSRIRF